MANPRHEPEASGSSNPTAAHPALPLLSFAGGRPPNPKLVATPPTPKALHELILSTSTAELPYKLVPVLNALADGHLRDNRPDQANAILTLNGIDVGASTDEDIKTYTAGLIFVVGARLYGGQAIADPSSTLDFALRICENANSMQIALIPTRVTEFAWAVLDVAKQFNQVERALGPLQALLRSSSVGSYFNGVHATFLEACLLSRNVAVAYRSLNVVYLDVFKDTPHLDVLTYHYHAGTVSAAVGDYDAALDLFAFAVSAPTNSPSAIQVASYKRAILCQLLSTGTLFQLPKATNSNVARMLHEDKSLADYTKLAKSYNAKQWTTVQDAASNAIFDQDGNRGLVQQINSSIIKQGILTLRRTYSRLTLGDLTAKVGRTNEGEVRSLLEQMVSLNKIRAIISEATTTSPVIVTFPDDDDYDSPAKMHELGQAASRAQFYQNDLMTASLHIGLSSAWLKKQAYRLDGTKGRGDVGSKGLSGGSGDFGARGSSSNVRGVARNLADTGY